MRTRASKKRAETKYSPFPNGRCLTEFSCRFGQRTEETEENDPGLSEGLSLYQQGDFEGALEAFKEEERLLREGFGAESGSMQLYQDIVFHIGNCYYRMKDYEKAI